MCFPEAREILNSLIPIQNGNSGQKPPTYNQEERESGRTIGEAHLVDTGADGNGPKEEISPENGDDLAVYLRPPSARPPVCHQQPASLRR